MNPFILSFFIPFLAGISTLIGYFPTYIPSYYHDKVIGFSLSFSAGVMVAISCLSLIPEAISYLKGFPSLPSFLLFSIFFLLGILFSFSIDQIITKKKETKLYQIGIVSMITLILHNLPEGILSYLTTTKDLKLGISLSFAIAIHNIPEGIAIAIPIYFSTKSRRKSILYTALSGFSEVLGAILAYFFFKNTINSYLFMTLLDTTSGVMLMISFKELIPNSFDYLSLKEFLYSFLGGILLMSLCIFYFHI